MGSSQPASVPGNTVAPLCAVNCYHVGGLRGVAVGTEYKNPAPSARPNTCPGHSAAVILCSKRDPSRRAIKKSDLFTKQSGRKSQNALSLTLCGRPDRFSYNGAILSALVISRRVDH